MYLFFDTETTGLPKNYNAPVSDSKNWPRMVQIAWILYDNSSNQIESKSYIIKPEGYTIPKEVSAIHGITTEIAEKEGVDLSTVLQEFKQSLSKTKTLIAHNISFDEAIVGAEFFRKQIEGFPKTIVKFDTMKSSTNFCKIPGRYGFKWPNLTELYLKVFGKTFEKAHDALADVQACAACYFELKKRNVF